MKNIKLYIGIIIGLVLSGITVYALSINSKDVSYKTTNVSDAIDDLYEKVANSASKFCELKSGNALEVGSMYECDPGDGIKRNFYILSLNGENGVDLIMDRNITDSSFVYSTAVNYFRSGDGVIIKNSWTNIVSIDLPTAQAITDAVNNDSWLVSDNAATWWCFGTGRQDLNINPWCSSSTAATYHWLYDNLSGCSAVGCLSGSDATPMNYWTRDLAINSNPSRAWAVWNRAFLEAELLTTSAGIRPVITVLKGNLK